MKKILFYSVFALVSGILGVSHAEMHKASAPMVNTITIQEALQMNDDMPVMIVGKITKSLGHERYQLEDDTGIATVEIDDDDVRGMDWNNEDSFLIIGEIDKDGDVIEIEADRIIKQ